MQIFCPLSTLRLLLSNKVSIWLQSIQHGFISTLPVVILGALALTVLQMGAWIFPDFQVTSIRFLSHIIQQACYGLMAVTLVLSITQKLAKYYQQKYQLNFDPLIVAVLAMVTLVAMSLLEYEDSYYQYLGVQAIAKGLLCSIVFTELYVYLFRYRIFKAANLNESVESSIITAMHSIWPALLAPCIFLVFYSLLSDWFHLLSFWFPVFIGEVNTEQGFTLWQTIKLIVVNQLSWFVGIHGSSIVEVHASTLFVDDPAVVYSRQYINMFVHIGGAGGTFGLVIALLLSKQKSSHHLGRYAFLPSLFNINELLIFGLPIIFNRFLLLPFILVPVLTASIFKIAFDLGWVAWSGGAESWSTPILFGGYLATGQWQGVALQVFFIALSAAVYYPFLVRYENNHYQQEVEKQARMLLTLNNELDLKSVYQSKSEIGRFSRTLLSDFELAIKNSELELFYQPKANKASRVVGAEALLRWNHKQLGAISPAVIVELSELHGCIHDLGLWVVKRSLSDATALNKAGIHDLKIAINVSPCQFERRNFFDQVINIVERSGIAPNMLELEITEGQKIELSDRVLIGLQQLSDYGFRIAVDDFGMGYTSLRYLKSFPVDTLKIDGSIIKDVADSKVVQEIIGSMGQLAGSMGVNLIAEWVETDTQKQLLQNLGCDEFQGYLMSPPITLNELTKYCAVNGVESPVNKKNKSMRK